MTAERSVRETLSGGDGAGRVATTTSATTERSPPRRPRCTPRARRGEKGRLLAYRLSSPRFDSPTGAGQDRATRSRTVIAHSASASPVTWCLPGSAAIAAVRSRVDPTPPDGPETAVSDGREYTLFAPRPGVAPCRSRVGVVIREGVAAGTRRLLVRVSLRGGSCRYTSKRRVGPVSRD